MGGGFVVEQQDQDGADGEPDGGLGGFGRGFGGRLEAVLSILFGALEDHGTDFEGDDPVGGTEGDDPRLPISGKRLRNIASAA